MTEPVTSPSFPNGLSGLRTEAEVRDAKVIPLNASADVLTPLLEAERAAKKILDAADMARNKLTSTDSLSDIIAADITRRHAFEDWYRADEAYKEAIAAHCNRLREARQQ